MDLHSNNVYCGIIDQAGARVKGKKLPLDLAAILDFLEPYRDKLVDIVVESTYNWYWLVDGLQERCYPVRLANPAETEKYSGLKYADDKSDAFWLAEMSRLRILPTGYIYPKEIRPIRDLFRRRLLLVRQHVQTLQSVQTMIARSTAETISCSKLSTWTARDVKACLKNVHLQQTALYLLEVADKQQRVIAKIEMHAGGEVKLFGRWRLLVDVPGIAEILGATIMLETGPIERFANVGRYASYIRGVKSEKWSNNKKKGKGNLKNGNKYLAWAFVEAAQHAQRHYPEIKSWFERKMRKTNRNVAIKALACKLAKAVYYILRDNVEFDMQKMFG